MLNFLGGLESQQRNNDLARQHYDKAAVIYAEINLPDHAAKCRELRDKLNKKGERR
jgi:hypothetical protein